MRVITERKDKIKYYVYKKIWKLISTITLKWNRKENKQEKTETNN